MSGIPLVEGERYTEDISGEEKRGKLLPQFLVAIIGSLTHLGIGTIIGYPAVTLPSLTDKNSTDITLNKTQEDIFGSLLHLGSIMGCICSGATMVHFGQRKTLQLVLPLVLIGWLMLAFGDSVWLIQMARVILGFSVGVNYSTASNYVIEVVHPVIRGRFSALVDLSRQLGFLFVYAVGSTCVTWRQLAFICGGVTVVLPFVGLALLPHSPRWLASVNRIEDARKSLRYLRGRKYNVEVEIEEIRIQILRRGPNSSWLVQFKRLFNPSIIDRFVCLVMIFVLFSFNGNSSFLTYATDIFQATNAKIDRYTCTVLAAGSRALGTLSFVFIGDKFGRRTLLHLPLLSLTGCLAALGAYFYFQSLPNEHTSHIDWLPVTSLILYQYILCLMPYTIVPGELLPTSARAVGVSLLWMMSFFFTFISTFTFPLMATAMGMYGVFWFYGGVCFIMALLVILFLPETQGMSLEEIDEQHFRRGSILYRIPNPVPEEKEEILAKDYSAYGVD